MKPWRALVIVSALLLAGCASAVDGHPVVAPAAPNTGHFGGTPAPGTSANGSPTAFPRVASSTEFGDPPRVDVCRTLGSSMFRVDGYYADAPQGSRAASCTYYLNSTQASTGVRPQIFVDVFVDSGGGDSGLAGASIGPYGLDVTQPKKSGDPCVDDVLTGQVDVDIQASPGRTQPPASTLCAVALTAAHRAAEVMQAKAIVDRALATDSVTKQDLCAATDSTASRAAVQGQEYQLGFDTACRYQGVEFEYWVELRFGIEPTEVQSQPAQVDGHSFATDLDSPDGYCRYRWQGPPVPGTSEYEEVTVKRTAQTAPGKGVSCVDVGTLAGQVITALGRH